MAQHGQENKASQKASMGQDNAGRRRYVVQSVAGQGRAGNKCRGSEDLVIDSLLQKVLVRPQPAVSGGQLLLQARWGQLIQPRSKPGQVVPAQHTAQKT